MVFFILMYCQIQFDTLAYSYGKRVTLGPFLLQVLVKEVVLDWCSQGHTWLYVTVLRPGVGLFLSGVHIDSQVCGEQNHLVLLFLRTSAVKYCSFLWHIYHG